MSDRMAESTTDCNDMLLKLIFRFTVLEFGESLNGETLTAFVIEMAFSTKLTIVVIMVVSVVLVITDNLPQRHLRSESADCRIVPRMVQLHYTAPDAHVNVLFKSRRGKDARIARGLPPLHFSPKINNVPNGAIMDRCAVSVRLPAVGFVRDEIVWKSDDLLGRIDGEMYEKIPCICVDFVLPS